MHFVREVVLDTWSSLEDRDGVNERNNTAHGAKAAMDVATISWYAENPQESDRLRKWKASFRQYYGVQYSEVSGIIAG